MNVQISILDVGNRDCIVIEEGQARCVLDAPQLGLLRAWLWARGRRAIDWIFLTHDHADHFPGLVGLVEFARAWEGDSCTLGKIVLPQGVLRRAHERLAADKSTVKAAGWMRLQNALDWFQANPTKATELDAGSAAPRLDQATFSVLWPTLAAKATVAGHNDTSLVLRLVYGSFAAVFLADLEGPGLEALASGLGGSVDVRSQLVKVPHHGGWPKEGAALRRLLDAIDPEYALLSVGSTNSHKHVRPELFAALLGLRGSGRRFRGLACTEVTRTCVQSAAERDVGDRQGLVAPRPCAGDIEIVAEHGGAWSLTRAAEHSRVIDGVERPACRGKADLG